MANLFEISESDYPSEKSIWILWRRLYCAKLSNEPAIPNLLDFNDISRRIMKRWKRIVTKFLTTNDATTISIKVIVIYSEVLISHTTQPIPKIHSQFPSGIKHGVELQPITSLKNYLNSNNFSSIWDFEIAREWKILRYAQNRYAKIFGIRIYATSIMCWLKGVVQH